MTTRFRPSQREQRIAANKANAGMEAMFGDRREAKGIPALVPLEVKAKRVRKPAEGGEPTEQDIQRDIIRTLRADPRVSFVGRFNRGMAYGASGAPVQFNTVPGFPDLHGMLKGGLAYYIEVKRPKARTTEEQAAFLQGIRDDGGLAGIATSPAEALAILYGTA